MRKFCTTLALSSAIFLSATAWSDVKWTGCDVLLQSFMEEVAKSFEQKTGQKVTLSGGGASLGIRAVSAGNAQMGGTCRHSLRDAQGNLINEEKEADLVQVAWDALVVIAHKENPVNDIPQDKLKQVFDGKISSWKDLGGADNPIALVTREGKTSGVGYMFRAMVFNDVNYDYQARSLKEKDTTPLEKRVEKTPNAMAIDGISSAKKRELKILSIDGAVPNKENIASGKYPLFRPLYLTLPKNPSPEAKSLLDYTLSHEGQAIIAREGTVNLEEGQALVALWDSHKAKIK